MNTKAIVLDLDGTLLKNDKSISDYTVEVLRKYSEIGKIIIASGRSLIRIKKYSDQFETAGIVAMNGGAIYKKYELIKQFDINPENIKELVHKIAALPERELSVWYPTTNLTSNPIYARPQGPTYYSDFKDFETHEIQKITVDTPCHDEIKNLDLMRYGCKLLLNAHEPNFFVFANETVSKKVGLLTLFEALDLKAEEVIAFGDDFNDYDMLQLCGKGVVVSNAPEVIKGIADEVCLSNEEDGVAHWIEENLLV